MYLDYIENEIATENLFSLIDREARSVELSERAQNRIARYAVSDEEIKELLFEVSLRSLCLLADKTLMEYYPQETTSEAEIDKIIDIVAQGMRKKSLSNKQQWCLASFIIYYMKINREEI